MRQSVEWQVFENTQICTWVSGSRLKTKFSVVACRKLNFLEYNLECVAQFIFYFM